MRKFNLSMIVGFMSAIIVMILSVPLMAQIGQPAGGDIKKTVVRTTSWGLSDNVTNNLTYNNPGQESVSVPSRALTNVLNSIFPSGVYKIFAFDELTPGFDRGNLTLLVAVGADTVAIINSGSGTNGCVTPTSLFTIEGDAPNVFVFTGGDLAAAGPLTYAEVTRNNTDNNTGYLYVGGCNGMARLQMANGNGWDNVAGLSPDDLDVNFTTLYSFNSIPSFDGSNVVAIQSSDANLLVLTTEKLISAPSNTTIALTIPTVSINAKYGTDLVLTPNIVIFATTGGVFWTDPLLAASPQLVPGITDTPISLAYVSETKGEASSEGNLFVVMVNRDNDRGSILRYCVNGAGVQSVVGAQPIVWNQFRRDISTDGLAFYSSRIASTDQNDLLQLYTYAGGINSLTNVINVPAGTRFAGRPVRDPASGGWVVPGQSVRVNE